MIDVVPFELEHIEMLAAPRVDFGEVAAFDNPSVFAFTGMKSFMQQGEMHRLQAAILVDDIPACRFARALGFKYEGEMPAYSSDGATCVRYGKVI